MRVFASEDAVTIIVISVFLLIMSGVFNLLDKLIAYGKKDAEMLEKLSVDTCMLCGCCSFVCPANRPLVQTNNLSKQFLRDERAKEAAKNNG